MPSGVYEASLNSRFDHTPLQKESAPSQKAKPERTSGSMPLAEPTQTSRTSSTPHKKVDSSEADTTVSKERHSHEAKEKADSTDSSSSVEPQSPEDDYYRDWPLTFSSHSFDEQKMNEEIDLSDEERRHLLFFHHCLDYIDHYQILGVSRDATRKEIRSAYFDLSKRFHPDVFYTKNIGSFSSYIDNIFQCLNAAHHTLSNKKRRAGYDISLTEHSQQEERSASVSISSNSQASSSVDSKKREMAFHLLVKRAEKLEAAGDFVAAAQEYKKAFSIQHDPAIALRGANLLMRCGEEALDEVILLAKAASKEVPNQSKPLILIGDAYEEKGDYASAKAYYKRAQDLDPDNKNLQRRLKYVEDLSDV